MTQQKNKVPNLRAMFLGLSLNEQQAVTSFFNLHNTAVWIHSNLSKEAQKYVKVCIKASHEAGQVEKDV